MIKIKKALYLSIIGIIFSSVQAFAQDKTPVERATKLTTSMDCELNLTSTQKRIIFAINLEAANKMDSAKAESKNNFNLYVRKGKAIDKGRNIELRDALNDKQFSIYERISKNDARALQKTANCR